MKQPPRRSPLALAILTLLYEAPMHPYRMQQLIKERGKEDVVNIRQRTSIYQTIDRLLRDGLITARGTSRDERRPERTEYELTDSGRETCREWLETMLAVPAKEFPEFPAALSFIALLTPPEAIRQLERREHALQEGLSGLERDLQMAGTQVPRLFLLETEYMRAMQATELAWIRSVLDDLRTERLTWSHEWLRDYATEGFQPDTSPSED